MDYDSLKGHKPCLPQEGIQVELEHPLEVEVNSIRTAV